MFTIHTSAQIPAITWLQMNKKLKIRPKVDVEYQQTKASFEKWTSEITPDYSMI